MIRNIQKIRKLFSDKPSLKACLICLFLITEPSQADFGNNYLICFKSEDLDGLIFKPLMYYFEEGRVKSYVLNKQITNDSIIASQKEYKVERNINEKYNNSGEKFIYWQEKNLTFLYNKTNNILRTRVLDIDKDSFVCAAYSSKNSFIKQVKKWKKLENLREPPRFPKD